MRQISGLQQHDAIRPISQGEYAETRFHAARNIAK